MPVLLLKLWKDSQQYVIGMQNAFCYRCIIYFFLELRVLTINCMTDSVTQVLYNRLYRGGSNQEGGTLLQLHNLINRCKVATDISGRFYEAINFFELVVRCHIAAAAMSYFGMKSVSDVPTQNIPPLTDGLSTENKWSVLKQCCNHH